MSLAENLGTFGRDRIARESGEVSRPWHTAQMLIVLAGLPGYWKDIAGP